MYVKIKNIEMKYEDEKPEPTSAEVSYSLMLNEGQLEGSMTIENDSYNAMIGWPICEFNKRIHQKIVSSM